jgi:hypothetical protein
MPNQTFNQFLTDEFMKQYDGTDDYAPDEEYLWQCGLEPDDWIELAEKYATKRALQSFFKRLNQRRIRDEET